MFGKILNVIKNFNDKGLGLLIFFVTDKCNLSCKTCFYWDKLNKGNELSLQDIKNFALQISRFNQLILSGGEPFLRNDLPQVIQIFVESCGVKEIDIPTNGLLTEHILCLTEEIVKNNAQTKIVISVSWDGLDAVNKTIRRGLKELDSIRETIQGLVKLSSSYKNLEVQINTVICKDNYRLLRDFLEYLQAQRYLGVKRHLFEIVRGTPRAAEEAIFAKEELLELKSTFKKVLDYQDDMFKDTLTIRNHFIRHLLSGFNYVNLKIIYRLQYDFFSKGAKWPMRCVSSWAGAAVIEHDGDIKLCELRSKIGNVKDKNFRKSMYGLEAKKERSNIIKNRCSCSHICFIYPSLYRSVKMVFLRLPFEYLKYLVGAKTW
jgi:MoaA/NifB/PqqE/SkfB family radical SAM enzyme